MIELKRLSPSDGIEIYDLLQSIPREENGLQNKVNGMTYEEYKQWLIGKQVESILGQEAFHSCPPRGAQAASAAYFLMRPCA